VHIERFHKLQQPTIFSNKVRKIIKINKTNRKIIYTHKHAAKNVLCAKKKTEKKEQQKQFEFDNQRRKYKQQKRERELVVIKINSRVSGKSA